MKPKTAELPKVELEVNMNISQSNFSMDEEIKTLAHEIGTMFQSAAQSGISHYRPIVHQILQGQITDPNEIEHILDYMLDYCFDDEMLSIYKSVCRHLFHKYPELVYNAVMNYKEVWDSDEASVEVEDGDK
jgi:hypothetical protein